MNEKLDLKRSKLRQFAACTILLFLPYFFEVVLLLILFKRFSDQTSNHDQNFLFHPMVDTSVPFVLIVIRFVAVLSISNEVFKDKKAIYALAGLSAIPVISAFSLVLLFARIMSLKKEVDKEVTKNIPKEVLQARSKIALLGNAAGCFIGIGIFVIGFFMLVFNTTVEFNGQLIHNQGLLQSQLIGVFLGGIALLIGGGFFIAYLMKK